MTAITDINGQSCGPDNIGRCYIFPDDGFLVPCRENSDALDDGFIYDCAGPSAIYDITCWNAIPFEDSGCCTNQENVQECSPDSLVKFNKN